MKTSRALLFTALLVPGAMTFAATSAQRASADAAAAAGAPSTLVEKMQSGASLTFTDIQDLARQRVPDDATLSYLRSIKSQYRLTTETFDQLRAAGVSDRVTNYLLLASPLEEARPTRAYRPGSSRGYGYRPLRSGPGFGRLGGFGVSGPKGFGGQHRGGHHGGHR